MAELPAEVQKAVREQMVANVLTQIDGDTLKECLGVCLAELLKDWGTKDQIRKALRVAVGEKTKELLTQPEWDRRIEKAVIQGITGLIDQLPNLMSKAVG